MSDYTWIDEEYRFKINYSDHDWIENMDYRGS